MEKEYRHKLTGLELTHDEFVSKVDRDLQGDFEFTGSDKSRRISLPQLESLYIPTAQSVQATGTISSRTFHSRNASPINDGFLANNETNALRTVRERIRSINSLDGIALSDMRREFSVPDMTLEEAEIFIDTTEGLPDGLVVYDDVEIEF